MCGGLGGKPRQMFEGTKNKRYIQIYRQNLRIDGDFYNLLALSGRNLIKSFCVVGRSNKLPSRRKLLATMNSLRSLGSPHFLLSP